MTTVMMMMMMLTICVCRLMGDQHRGPEQELCSRSYANQQ